MPQFWPCDPTVIEIWTLAEEPYNSSIAFHDSQMKVIMDLKLNNWSHETKIHKSNYIWNYSDKTLMPYFGIKIIFSGMGIPIIKIKW